MTLRDDCEITLLAHTGNAELAKQFGEWYQWHLDYLMGLIGIDPEVFNQSMLDLEMTAVQAIESDGDT
jgi:hypothetical protein